MSKVLITGSEGLVGNALKRLDWTGHTVLYASRRRVNLTKQDQVESLFSEVKPDMVIHAAARVGGIQFNLDTPAQQFHDNIMMNTLVLDAAYRHGVTNLVAFGTACSFPGDLTVFGEDSLHAGEPYPAHRSYAYAKRMVDVQIEAYNKQYGLNWCSLIPGNIFGENDNFNLTSGHVVPSLIRKCYEASLSLEHFNVWGTGQARREFIYSGDIARIVRDLLFMESPPQKVLATGESYSILEIASMIMEAFGYHNINWETNKPEGQKSRVADKTMFNSKFKDFEYSDMQTSLAATCQWFKENYDSFRS